MFGKFGKKIRRMCGRKKNKAKKTLQDGDKLTDESYGFSKADDKSDSEKLHKNPVPDEAFYFHEGGADSEEEADIEEDEEGESDYDYLDNVAEERSSNSSSLIVTEAGDNAVSAEAEDADDDDGISVRTEALESSSRVEKMFVANDNGECHCAEKHLENPTLAVSPDMKMFVTKNVERIYDDIHNNTENEIESNPFLPEITGEILTRDEKQLLEKFRRQKFNLNPLGDTKIAVEAETEVNEEQARIYRLRKLEDAEYQRIIDEFGSTNEVKRLSSLPEGNIEKWLDHQFSKIIPEGYKEVPVTEETKEVKDIEKKFGVKPLTMLVKIEEPNRPSDDVILEKVDFSIPVDTTQSCVSEDSGNNERRQSTNSQSSRRARRSSSLIPDKLKDKPPKYRPTPNASRKNSNKPIYVVNDLPDDDVDYISELIQDLHHKERQQLPNLSASVEELLINTNGYKLMDTLHPLLPEHDIQDYEAAMRPHGEMPDCILKPSEWTPVEDQNDKSWNYFHELVEAHGGGGGGSDNVVFDTAKSNSEMLTDYAIQEKNGDMDDTDSQMSSSEFDETFTGKTNETVTLIDPMEDNEDANMWIGNVNHLHEASEHCKHCNLDLRAKMETSTEESLKEKIEERDRFTSESSVSSEQLKLSPKSSSSDSPSVQSNKTYKLPLSTWYSTTLMNIDLSKNQTLSQEIDKEPRAAAKYLRHRLAPGSLADDDLRMDDSDEINVNNRTRKNVMKYCILFVLMKKPVENSLQNELERVIRSDNFLTKIGEETGTRLHKRIYSVSGVTRLELSIWSQNQESIEKSLQRLEMMFPLTIKNCIYMHPQKILSTSCVK